MSTRLPRLVGHLGLLQCSLFLQLSLLSPIERCRKAGSGGFNDADEADFEAGDPEIGTGIENTIRIAAAPVSVQRIHVVSPLSQNHTIYLSELYALFVEPSGFIDPIRGFNISRHYTKSSTHIFLKLSPRHNTNPTNDTSFEAL